MATIDKLVFDARNCGTLSRNHQLDLLKVDVQGAEKLDGGTEPLKSAQIIFAETAPCVFTTCPAVHFLCGIFVSDAAAKSAAGIIAIKWYLVQSSSVE